jgi:hypothetical protein
MNCLRDFANFLFQNIKLLPVCRDRNSQFQLFELARLLMRLDHIARLIEYANHSIMWTAKKKRYATFAVTYLPRCRCFLPFLIRGWAARHSRCFRV